MSDELVKIDHTIYQTVLKIERTYYDIEGDEKILSVNNCARSRLRRPWPTLDLAPHRSRSLRLRISLAFPVGRCQVSPPPPSSRAVRPHRRRASRADLASTPSALTRSPRPQQHVSKLDEELRTFTTAYSETRQQLQQLQRKKG